MHHLSASCHLSLLRGPRLTQPSGARTILASYAWSPVQKVLLEEMLGELRLAEERRRRLSAMMAQEVASDPQLLALMRLMGVRHLIAFAIAAVVEPIKGTDQRGHAAEIDDQCIKGHALPFTSANSDSDPQVRSGVIGNT